MSSHRGPTKNRLFAGDSWNSHQFIADVVMDDQLKHHISMMFFGMADLGECLDVARQIEPGDEHGWLDAWTATARRVQERAERAEARGKRVSAASAYLRASTYWRASLMHYSFHDDPRVREHSLQSYECYDRYLEHSGYPGMRIDVPYEDSHLPAYLYRSPSAPARAPLLIFHQGRDAWPEDTRWVYQGAIDRGIHCLAVHGPGQGLAIRINDLPFRHDWEAAITPVVDVAEQLEGVDPDRIGLMGLSFGGYLAPRAAAFEHRLKVCIANPGVLDWGASILAGMGPELAALRDLGKDGFNAAIASLDPEPTRDWFLRDAAWKHGVDTPWDFIEAVQACDLTDDAKRIECETLVMDGVREEFSAGQAQQLYDALECPKELMLLDVDTTAELHCQNGANATAAELMFDWLDGRL